MVTIIDYWHHLAPVSDAGWYDGDDNDDHEDAEYQHQLVFVSMHACDGRRG